MRAAVGARLRLHGVGALGGGAHRRPGFRRAGGADDDARVVTMRPMLRGIGLFIAGFTLVFVALGAAASGIGHLLASHKETLTHVSGFVVIVLGSRAPRWVPFRAGSGPDWAPDLSAC